MVVDVEKEMFEFGLFYDVDMEFVMFGNYFIRYVIF